MFLAAMVVPAFAAEPPQASPPPAPTKVVRSPGNAQWASTPDEARALAAAQKKSKETNKLIFVDLFADWCGWGHRMEQEGFPSMVFQSATDDMVLLRLNTEDGGDGTLLARQFQVTSLPTFLILNSAGQLAGIIHGYQPANVFVDLLKEQEKKASGQ